MCITLYYAKIHFYDNPSCSLSPSAIGEDLALNRFLMRLSPPITRCTLQLIKAYSIGF